MPERHDTDLLFKALADPSRRKLLDLLHAHDGRSLNDLCEHLDMSRSARHRRSKSDRRDTGATSPA